MNDLTKKDSGDIKGINDLTSLSEIVEAINFANKYLNLSESFLELKNDVSLSNATIIAKDDSNIFTGEVTVSYN